MKQLKKLALLLLMAVTVMGVVTACDDDDNSSDTVAYSNIGFSVANGSLSEMSVIEKAYKNYYNEAGILDSENSNYFKSGTKPEVIISCSKKAESDLAGLTFTGYYVFTIKGTKGNGDTYTVYEKAYGTKK